MPRPPLPLGTHGSVRLYRTEGGYRARTLVRDYDGTTRPIERSGRSRGAAESALKAAVRDRSHADFSGDLTPGTRVKVVAEEWFMQLHEIAPTTRQGYRDRLDKQVIPGLGNLRICELTVHIVHRHLRAVEAKHGPSLAKMTRTVLSGVCGWAAQQGAVDRNPVRDAGRTRVTPRKAPRALTIPEIYQLRAALTYDDRAIIRDVPDLISFLLATGLRIGEACAVKWAAVDVEAGTIGVKGTVVYLKDRGAVISENTKSIAGLRTLILPVWCVDMLRRRERREDVVFPAHRGGLRDPSNTQADLRDALAKAGFDWVTSHTMRKTVATLMDQAGLSARAAADQLGHAKPSMTQDVYMGRKVPNTGAAAVLEILAIE